MFNNDILAIRLDIVNWVLQQRKQRLDPVTDLAVKDYAITGNEITGHI